MIFFLIDFIACYFVVVIFVCDISLLNNKKSLFDFEHEILFEDLFLSPCLLKAENVYFYGTFESINVLLQDAVVFSFVSFYSPEGMESS